MGDGNGREATYRFLNAEIGDLQRSLSDDARGLDTKATLVAGFAAASVSFLLDRPGGLLWWCAIAAHGAALALSLAVLWPRTTLSIIPRRLLDFLGDVPVGSAVETVAAAKAEAHEQLQRRVGAVTTTWAISAGALVVGMVLTVWTRVTG